MLSVKIEELSLTDLLTLNNFVITGVAIPPTHPLFPQMKEYLKGGKFEPDTARVIQFLVQNRFRSSLGHKANPDG